MPVFFLAHATKRIAEESRPCCVFFIFYFLVFFTPYDGLLGLPPLLPFLLLLLPLLPLLLLLALLSRIRNDAHISMKLCLRRKKQSGSVTNARKKRSAPTKQQTILHYLSWLLLMSHLLHGRRSGSRGGRRHGSQGTAALPNQPRLLTLFIREFEHSRNQLQDLESLLVASGYVQEADK